ncbi:hypothetical protein KY362_04425 [Candidatus Woesearchaeota archaeon]|nr:hypothetical protein [Candidatus Woesearchaeota archaeon]
MGSHKEKRVKAEASERLLAIDESLREIASLDELYAELVGSEAGSRDLDIKREEARFARDRLLRLSLHVKNLLAELESQALRR